MPSPDESTVRLPDGTEVIVTRRAADPQRESFELQMTIPPDGVASPPHVHPDQTDEFDVVSGEFEVLDGDSWRTLRAGDTLVIPPGRVHTYRNRSGGTAVVRNVHDPAGSFQEYVDRIGLLASAGKLHNMRSPRALLYMSLLVSEHTDSMRLSKPLARAGVTVVARVARLLGRSVPRPQAGRG